MKLEGEGRIKGLDNNGEIINFNVNQTKKLRLKMIKNQAKGAADLYLNISLNAANYNRIEVLIRSMLARSGGKLTIKFIQ